MYFVRSWLFLVPAACLLAQSPAPKPQSSQAHPAPPPAASPKVEFSVENDAKAAPAVAPDKVVLTVGDEKITAAEWNQMIEALPPQFRNAARGAGRRQFADNVVKIKLLAQEARRKKLDQAPAFRSQLAFQSDNLLANFLFQDLANNANPTEQDSRQFYDQHKSEYEQVKARHILIRMKGSPLPLKPGQQDAMPEEALAKAQELRKKLIAGADFATVAKAESDDTGSAANGGELGTFKHGQMVPTFEQAAFSLPVGQVSEPVKTQFGYHLIEVEERTAKSFEEMRPEIEKQIKPQIAQKAIEDLRKQTPVKLDDGYFGTEK